MIVYREDMVKEIGGMIPERMVSQYVNLSANKENGINTHDNMTIKLP